MASKGVPSWSLQKKIRLACADLLYYECKNILVLLCTPVVLIYNSELGIIISSEFFRAKKLWKKCYLLPSSYIYFFTWAIYSLFNFFT